MLTLDFESKKTTRLLGHKDTFNLISSLLKSNKLPNALMLSGNKGIGKSTIVNHLIYSYFDQENYDLKENTLIKKSNFYNLFTQNLHPNIFYLNGFEFKNIKIDDVRKLKISLYKSSIIEDKRFVILDDVETFNHNSLNALLKLIEEPNKNNFFILINNKSKSILETIESRCLNIKINLSYKKNNEIRSFLIDFFDQQLVLNEDYVKTSPGNFLRFNSFFNEKKMNIDDKFILNLNKILKFYRVEKNLFYKDLLFFFIEYSLQRKKTEKMINNKKIIENRILLFEKINLFFSYNLNQNSLLSFIEESLLNE